MKKSFLLAALALSVGGCSAGESGDQSAEPPPSAEQVANTDEPTSQAVLVGSVTLTNGNVLEFYESEPGNVLLSETGRIGVARSDLSRFKGVSLRAGLEALSLATPIPQSIDELDERRLQFARRLDAVVRESRPSVRAPNSDALPEQSELNQKGSAQNFRDTLCRHHGACLGQEGSDFFTGNNCWPNSTADYTYVRNDVNVAFAAVDAVIGAMTFRVRSRPWSSWNERGRWDVQPGTWRSASIWATCDASWDPCHCGDFDFEAKIWNASGDTYHITTQWDSSL